MRQTVTEDSELLRNCENYQADVDLQNPRETGIKASCLLNDFEHFHVGTNYAPDIMHDILEGICGLEVHLVLANLI